MSSKSPSLPKPNVVIIGSFWNAPLIARSFLDAGESAVQCLVLDRPAGTAPFPDEIFLSVGNGEYFDKACLIFGKSVAKELWAVSQRNYARAVALFKTLGIAYDERGTRWFDREKRDPGLTFSPRALSAKVAAGCSLRVVKQIDAIERAGTFETRVRFDGESVSSPIVVIASQLFRPALLPSFADKWLQVTLGSFSFPKPPGLDFSLALFNGGADFAVNESGGLRLGSFRNLFMDKAVGVHAAPDPATLAGVSRFFGDLGWIKKDDVPRPHVEVQTLSCDGLPIAGALADLPGVYLLAGFSGRVQNYVFEIASTLAEGIVRAKSFDGLRLFSTKRFV